MITNARAAVILDGEYVTGDKVSLHTAYSNTGANEVTGGTYARQSLTYAAASASTRSKATSASVSFTGLPASCTVAYIGTWDSTGTIFKGMYPNGATSKSFQVDLTNNKIICEGLGVVDGDRVACTGRVLPTNVTEGALLYVVGTTLGDPDTCQLSLTAGGAPIDLTTNQPSSDALITKVFVETYSAAGGQHDVPSITHYL